MTFAPQTITLKNKAAIQIRQAVPEDAVALICCIRNYVQNSDHLILTTEEFNPTGEQEEEWINSFRRSDNSLLLVALCGKEIIGNIDLNGSSRQRLKHTAMVGMGLLKTWRNTGLGTALLRAAIDWAKANPVLEQLWLQLYHNNEAGMALYRKFSFTEQGRQKDFIKLQEGKYADNVLMGLFLK